MLKGLRGLSQAIEQFRNLDDAVPARVIHAFLVIAGWDDGKEGPTMTELSTHLGIHSGVVTRHVAALSKQHRLGKPGLDLVEVHSDTRDPRFKRVRLTQKGKTLLARLLTTLGE